MTGAISYPALLLQGVEQDPFAVADGNPLFVCGRSVPPLGPCSERLLVDRSGRSWRLLSVRGVGLWGPWWQKAELWFLRQRIVDLHLEEGPTLTLDEVKARLSAALDFQQAELREAAHPAEGPQDQALAHWEEVRKEIEAADQFEALCQTVGYHRLSNEGWLSSSGRAGRLEYTIVSLSACAFVAALFAVFAALPGAHDGLVPFLVMLGLALAAFWPMLAAIQRRLHDIGRSGFWLALPAAGARLVSGLADWAGGSKLVGEYAMGGVLLAFLVALAAVRGNGGDNRYGPHPSTLI